jgi:elongation factor Ts
MAQITAQMVKELRESTGAGMMDCKAALSESGGEMDAAQDWLRKKGLSKAAKKSGRIAAEGLIGYVIRGPKAAIVELNSETDFVARNDMFQGLVKMTAGVAFEAGSDVEAIKAAKVGSISVGDAINDTIAKIGENMSLRRAAVLEVSKGVIGAYMHNSVTDGLGKIGVLVALESTGNVEELTALGRQLAMHVASSNPVALDASGVSADVVKREKDILADKFRQQGKPEAMIEKIVESGIQTFYKEQTFLAQPFIFDDSGKKSVAQAVKEAEGKVGGPIKIVSYVRFGLGEGIEKQESDFAAEVAAAAGPKS